MKVFVAVLLDYIPALQKIPTNPEPGSLLFLKLNPNKNEYKYLADDGFYAYSNECPVNYPWQLEEKLVEIIDEFDE